MQSARQCTEVAAELSLNLLSTYTFDMALMIWFDLLIILKKFEPHHILGFYSHQI